MGTLKGSKFSECVGEKSYGQISNDGQKQQKTGFLVLSSLVGLL